jgi:hypothetical protein
VNWGIEDFAAAAILILAVVLGIVAVRYRVKAQPTRRILITVMVIAALAVWAHLAVGIF